MVKSQRRIGVTNVRNISSDGDRPLWQILYANVKANRSYGTDTKSCQKPYKFDLDVKRQCRIGIMNVRDTSSHGDRPIFFGI